jgi:hypothetical protein
MHTRIFTGALLILILLSQPSAKALDVYIVAGQSNGWRLSTLAQDAKGQPDPYNVYYYGMHCVSEPDKSAFAVITSLSQNTMGYGLADGLRNLSDDDIIFIQFCRCGASIQDHSIKGWYPGDDPAGGIIHNEGLYGQFLKYMAHAKRSAEQDYNFSWDVKGLFWHQGEGDSNYPADQYETILPKLLWRFRADIRPDLPVVAAHIRALNDERQAINEALDRVAAADKNFVVVPSNDLSFEDETNVHFNKPGCHNLGKRMVEAYVKLTTGKK